MEKKKKIRKKICLIIAIVFIIIALLIPFVFAMPSENENQFFSVDSLTKTVGSTLEMKINLATINYNEFLIILTNCNKTLENIDTSNLEEDAQIEKENDNIVISGNKEKMNVNEIKLYYQIPQGMKVGDTLTFKATIEENITKTDENDSEGDISVDDNEDNTEQSKKQTIEITITIVEKENNNENTADSKNENNTNNKDNQDKNNQNKDVEPSKNESNKQDNKESIQGIEKNNENMQVSTKSTKIGNGSNLQSENVTYNGSSNNYLEKLSVKGHEFTTNFSKENTTYFIKLDEDITSLDITAKAEEDTATICIYGNMDIKDGSKVLVSVTAENGSVRTYRIYVSY